MTRRLLSETTRIRARALGISILISCHPASILRISSQRCHRMWTQFSPETFHRFQATPTPSDSEMVPSLKVRGVSMYRRKARATISRTSSCPRALSPSSGRGVMSPRNLPYWGPPSTPGTRRAEHAPAGRMRHRAAGFAPAKHAPTLAAPQSSPFDYVVSVPSGGRCDEGIVQRSASQVSASPRLGGESPIRFPRIS
jgi:hypothetical protein